VTKTVYLYALPFLTKEYTFIYLPHIEGLKGILMKIKIIGLTILLALAGCASPLNDMLNNKFVSITPQLTPESLVGIWSGNMGPYLTSFSFRGDGYGIFCYSYATADVTQKVKYSNNIIYIQDGTKLEIEVSTNDLLVVNANYFGSNKSTFYRDKDLKEASQFCGKELSN
jgi:hypothetical protein